MGQGASAEFNQQRAEQVILTSKEEADIANSVKSDFLANISHELRTPLNAIIEFSDLMDSETFGPLGDKRYKEYISGINSIGRHLLDIIMNILNTSKVESCHRPLNESEFHFFGLLVLCFSYVSELARAKNITVEKEFNGNAMQFFSNSVKISRYCSIFVF